MDLRRFLDLFVAESQEHLRLLQRNLLALEQGTAGAVDEAFRAAHTLKGLSAAMGYTAAAQYAHTLEDRLEGIRSGRVPADAAAIDHLLAAADALDSAVAAAVETGVPQAEQDSGLALASLDAGPAGDAPAPPADVPIAPAGTTAVLLVHLADDAPIKAARAMLIMRSLEGVGGVLGSAPAEFDEGFAGEFRVWVGPEADTDAVRERILAGGDVRSVEVRGVGAAVHGGPEVDGHGPVAAPANRGVPRPPPEQGGRAQLRVDAVRLDHVTDGITELAVVLNRLREAQTHGDGAASSTANVDRLTDRAASLVATLQRDVLALRLVPVREAFERLPRAVRDVARRLGRDAAVELSGDEVELDRAILGELTEPLLHLVRNAVSHGLESPTERAAAGKPERGTIGVAAQRERDSVVIRVRDDGRGVDRQRVRERAAEAGLVAADAVLDDAELLRLVSHPGLSTAREVNAVAGRGVGVDVVVNRIRALGGVVELRSEDGAGTEFVLRVPVTRALVPALRVRVRGEDYAIPLAHVSEAVELPPDGAAAGTVEVRGESLRLVPLAATLQAAGPGLDEAAVVSGSGERRAALVVDELVGRENILIKPFAAVPGMLPYFSGATLLADGRAALVLDPLSVI